MQIWGGFATGCVFIASTSFACVANDREQQHEGVAGTSAVLTGAAGNAALEACTADAAAPSPYDLGIDDGLTLDGNVSAVASDRIEVAAQGSTHIFSWRGPALDTAFAIGDAVEMSASDYYGYGSSLGILRSTTATAVVVNAQPWRVLEVEPGSTAELQLPAELPELVYGVGACCATGGSSHVGEHFRCDYSDLEASLAGATTAIPLGDTGTIGPWSVTNLRSVYHTQSEHFWEVQVTLLGPATPRALDGGR